MVRKKILMLSVSAGSGHTRAAEALRVRATGGHFDAAAIHLDMLAFVTPLLRALYGDVYNFLIKRWPALWRYVYHSTDSAQPAGLTHRVRRWAERINSKALLAQIEKCAPDYIICTHFLPAELLARLVATGKVDCPVWVQVTDFDLHRMWVHDHMAGYFAANQEVAFRLSGHGIRPEAIHITGIPIMPAFSGQLERLACARELGIDPQVTTVLLMGGGDGVGSVHALADHLLGVQEKFQLIALAGKDPAALAALQEVAARYPGRLVAQGYTNELERLMACADLIVTKPGGLTTSESLAMGLPMILIAPIPGQEERNANFLIEQGTALQAFDLMTLEYRLRFLLNNPATLAAMRSRAKALGRPDAAGRVLGAVLGKTGSYLCSTRISRS